VVGMPQGFAGTIHPKEVGYRCWQARTIYPKCRILEQVKHSSRM